MPKVLNPVLYPWHNEINCSCFHKKRMLLYHEGTVTFSMRKRQNKCYFL